MLNIYPILETALGVGDKMVYKIDSSCPHVTDSIVNVIDLNQIISYINNQLWNVIKCYEGKQWKISLYWNPSVFLGIKSLLEEIMFGWDLKGELGKIYLCKSLWRITAGSNHWIPKSIIYMVVPWFFVRLIFYPLACLVFTVQKMSHFLFVSMMSSM